ncbi:8281_t:CDS:2, partial [Racocetra persica]
KATLENNRRRSHVSSGAPERAHYQNTVTKNAQWLKLRQHRRLGELLPQCQQGMHKIPKIQSVRFDKANSNTFATIQLTRTKTHKTTERP